jgi:hypothetical protein
MPTYATAADLRGEYVPALTDEQMSDAEANRLLEQAEDLIDDALGARPIDTDTGRKVRLSDFDENDWRIGKLTSATAALARRISENPSLLSDPLYDTTTGEVTLSGPRGSRFGARVEALLNATGLRRLTTTASGASGRGDALPRVN